MFPTVALKSHIKVELDDLVRDLSLSKEKSEILVSRLKEWNLLERGVTISHSRDRHKKSAAYYVVERGDCFCHVNRRKARSSTHF